MDWLSNFSNINVYTMVVLLLVVVVGIISVKKGFISFKGEKLSIGQDIKTRNLIQNQLEYTKAKCEGLTILYRDKVEEYKLKYIIARVEDVFERAVIFNNLSDDEGYVRAKQELVYQTILKRATCGWVLDDEFKAFVYKFVADIFKELYRMKRVQS